MNPRSTNYGASAVVPLLIWTCFAVLGLGCDGSGGATKVQDPQLKAKLIWENRCGACHGVEGRGDGEAVPGLRAVPRNLTNIAWQDSVSDERIYKVIVEGGPSINLSHVMSPNPDLANDPKTVNELVKIVRGLKAQEVTK